MTLRLLGSMLVLLALSLPASAANVSYEGTVQQGETDVHRYPGVGSGDPCDEILVPYTAVLSYAPEGDTLSLSRGDLSVPGVGGRAYLTFYAGVCWGFELAVTGTCVEDAAAYTLTIEQGILLLPTGA